MTSETKDRRGLLKAVAAFFGGLFGLPSAAALLEPALEAEASSWRRAAALGDLPEGATIPFDVEVRSGWESRKVRGFLRREGDGVRAFDARCTHLGCTVRLREGAFRCPCHGGVFSLEGEPREGPVTEPLGTWETRVEGGQVLVRI